MRKAIFGSMLAILFFSETSFAQNQYVSETKINNVAASANGVTFTYGGGQGQSPRSVTIPGTVGDNCLRMWMYVEAYKKGMEDSFGVTFILDVTAKTCTAQLHPIGA